MASSVKGSLSRFYTDDKPKNKNKENEKVMSTDDFYKQASQEFLKDVAEQGIPEVENENEEQPGENVTMNNQVEENPEIVVTTPEPIIEELQPEPVAPAPVAVTPPPQQAHPAPAPAPVLEADGFEDDFADDFDDFDFVDHYGDEGVSDISQLLPENTAKSAINCAFVGIGGGGGKMAKAFLD